MKDTFVFYVDANRPKKGHQSKHVATVAVIRKFTLDGRPYFRVGVTAKHQKDKLPFIKSEGRRQATERAAEGRPIFVLGEIRAEARRLLCREVRDMAVLLLIDSERLFSRIETVLMKFLVQRDICADCGEETLEPIYFMRTSARCPQCHAIRVTPEK